jgi:hypothetical protein
MVRKRTLALGVVGALAVGLTVRAIRAREQTERVPYTVMSRVGETEIRRYPTRVVAETTAGDEYRAFGRLLRYITGANQSTTEVSMTAPVETGATASATDTASGAEIAMTAPVETGETEGGVRMRFYLPADYDIETAPEPTDPAVGLVELPAQTCAVRRFSWWTTDGRVERQIARLRDDLGETGEFRPIGEPTLLRYDPPWTPPFLRTNEVAVETTGDAA